VVHGNREDIEVAHAIFVSIGVAGVDKEGLSNNYAMKGGNDAAEKEMSIPITFSTPSVDDSGKFPIDWSGQPESDTQIDCKTVEEWTLFGDPSADRRILLIFPLFSFLGQKSVYFISQNSCYSAKSLYQYISLLRIL